VVLPRLRPLPLKDRVSVVWVEKGRLDMLDGAFVVVDKNGVRTHIPVGSVACLMLEPGTRVSHRAVELAARVGCLLLWVGESGVRLYAAGQPGGARSDRLLYQAKLALDEGLRLKVVRAMYAIRFGEEPPAKRSIEQLRGLEAARVRRMYQNLSDRFGIRWKGRKYDASHWEGSDTINQSLSAATAALYGITEAAILAAGYAPAIGFIHWGKPRSFVYDIADLVKFETVVPVAFEVASREPEHPERAVRQKCRDAFRKSRIVERLIPLIDEVLAAAGVKPPGKPSEALDPVLPDKGKAGDAGHRG
jgi:CRISPR-associated protein Cas1